MCHVIALWKKRNKMDYIPLCELVCMESWCKTVNYGNLLDDLTERIGCEYLSNLRSEQWKEPLSLIIQKIVPENYTLDEWNESISYLTEDNRKFSTQKEARDFLIECLKGK